ncbi:MAG TPA: hypothetical protein PLK06_01965 [bacterium]|nr:hypothetical protein [bacterium]
MADFVNEQNAKRGHYAEVIKDIADKQVCPFCPEQLANFHKNPIRKYGHWIVTNNMYPYKPVKQHILLIHEAHIEHASEISAEAWSELQDIVKQETAERDMIGGALTMRFGDTHYTGASVAHLHAHLVQSDPDAPDYDPEQGVRVRIG